MTVHGSLHNVLYDTARDASETVKVGDGATVVHYTDRTACTVIEIRRNGKEIVVQEDFATRSDGNGMSDAQSYTYERNVNGKTYTATLRKDGGFRLKGWGLREGGRVLVGGRSHYFDYSF